MQTAANTNRFLTGRSSKAEFADSEIVVTRGELLQHIVTRQFSQSVHSQELFVKLTNQLIRFAEQAYVIRNVDELDDASQVLTGYGNRGHFVQHFKRYFVLTPSEYRRRVSKS